MSLSLSSPILFNSVFPETLERLRLTANINQIEWYDILQTTWQDYQKIKLGHLSDPEKISERVAQYFNLKTEDVLSGQIDYRALALRLEPPTPELPEIYSKAAFGRKRTSITSINFLEKHVSWRLRLESIRKLGVTENQLQDPFAPISMKFITDLCGYLHRRQFQKKDFFEMGAFTYEGNKGSLVARLFSELNSVKEAYEFFFNDCIKLFEQNCNYEITRIDEKSLTVEYLTDAHVAAESGIPHLGSTHVCQVKIGLIANIPRYLGHPAAQIKEVACVHCGDDVCRLEIDF